MSYQCCNMHVACHREGQTGEDPDFVFEEFVRLRVSGVEESNETEA